ncbi:MAG: hypothetical protein JNK78_18130 [Planctomycetes bacterium]|nr:hypothetical protein [Planctomycetota bacterium]
MAGRKRRGPPPLPPPIAGIVIDGSNVIASSRARPIERLDVVVSWFRAWREDLPIQVFVDCTTARRCRPDAQAVLRARCEDVTPGRARYAVVPLEEMADEVVLRHARAHAALVVSNDRFFDHEELRKNVITVQFTLADLDLAVYDEATWFRSPGTAQRVPMDVLRERRASA